MCGTGAAAHEIVLRLIMSYLHATSRLECVRHVLLLQARFTIFMPVQALDLAIVTASSGILCKQPAAERGVPWHCMLTMLVSHVLVAYLIDGALVWYMDRQARRKFVLLHALVSNSY